MPDRTKTALTPYQRGQLRLLLQRGCIGRDTALSALEMREALPGVIGILIDKGYALKRSRKTPGGVRAASYWLTTPGQELARELEAAQG